MKKFLLPMLLFLSSCSPSSYELRDVGDPHDRIFYLDDQGSYWYDEQKDYLESARRDGITPDFSNRDFSIVKMPRSKCRIEQKWVDRILEQAQKQGSYPNHPIFTTDKLFWSKLIRHPITQQYILIGEDKSGQSVIKIRNKIYRYPPNSNDYYLTYAFSVCTQRRMQERQERLRK